MTNAYDPAILALREERTSLSRTVTDLESRLAAEKARLENVQLALASLELVANPNVARTPPRAPVPEAPTVMVTAKQRGSRLRTPALVAEIVADFGRVATREEIIEEAVRRVGDRVSEWKDPRNVITVALNRADDQGLLVKIDRDHYRLPEPEITTNGGEGADES